MKPLQPVPSNRPITRPSLYLPFTVVCAPKKLRPAHGALQTPVMRATLRDIAVSPAVSRVNDALLSSAVATLLFVHLDLLTCALRQRLGFRRGPLRRHLGWVPKGLIEKGKVSFFELVVKKNGLCDNNCRNFLVLTHKTDYYIRT